MIELEKVDSRVEFMEPISSPKKWRGGLRLYPSQIEAINKLMRSLVDKLPARFAFLTEMSGQEICFEGQRNLSDKGEIDTNALGALVAGDLAASLEIARLTGEHSEYELVLRQGPSGSTCISDVGKSMALLVQFSREVPMGWARIVIVQVAKKIAEAAIPIEQPQEALFDTDGDKLNELFNNTFDTMWTEDSDVR
jgi:predicted regulator of Ras-like GTPase activity (Roadblock/LC7/MglB family)